MDVPRLEGVAEIVRLQTGLREYDVRADDNPVQAAAKVLRLATDTYRMLATGLSPGDAVGHMRRCLAESSRLHEALAQLVPTVPDLQREVPLDIEHLTPGMLLARDVRSENGLRLAGHGTVLTQPLIERLYFYRTRMGVAVVEPIYVYQRVGPG
jgi:hypothetical protein